MKVEQSVLFSCDNLPEKEKRNLTIFELIRKKGFISKPEISKITGINIVSVSNYIENYVARKFVSEKGSDVSTGGRKPDLVELNREDRFVVGVDAHPGGVAAAVCDLGGRALAKVALPAAKAGADELSGRLGDAFEQVLKKAALGPDAVEAVGLGGEEASVLPAGAALGKRFGVAVFMGGAAQCAAFGERAFNGGVDADDTLLYMHSDLGYGIVIQGCVCFGAFAPDGKAGNGSFSDEIAYLRPWSRELGIAEAARAQVARGIGTKIVDAAEGRLENITTDSVIAAARKDDKVAADLIRSAGINLGVRAAYLINTFSPRTVIIGGGIEQAGDAVFGPLKNMVARFSFAKQAARARIVPGALGRESVSLGAASLAAREVFLRA